MVKEECGFSESRLQNNAFMNISILVIVIPTVLFFNYLLPAFAYFVEYETSSERKQWWYRQGFAPIENLNRSGVKIFLRFNMIAGLIDIVMFIGLSYFIFTKSNFGIFFLALLAFLPTIVANEFRKRVLSKNEKYIKAK